MSKVVFLDAGPLGLVIHPRADQEIVAWLKRLLQSGVSVLIPEIADYEVRRELLRLQKPQSVERLDQLKVQIGYAPLTTQAMLKAAEFWAKARNEGYPTADDKALDADVILAAQVTTMTSKQDEAVIATTNVGHLARFVPAQEWRQIS
jgi:predicted nucleic acid-binding protein